MPRTQLRLAFASEPLNRQQQYQSLKTKAKQLGDATTPNLGRISVARAFCTAMLGAYWTAICRTLDIDWPVRSLGLTVPTLAQESHNMACDLGTLVAAYPVEEAGYLLGSVYTVMLPEAMRSEMGAYYTPPPIVNRLLDLAYIAGTDFSTCTAIDPACGGGAFLVAVALRMLKHTTQNSAKLILESIVTRLHGLELDPFAAWMTLVLLEASLLPLCVEAQVRVPQQVVTVGDALTQDSIGKFDLVVGNPPYGRVRLDDAMRVHYARSLYGHANLYGLFTDLALRLVAPNGVIAYLNPTSFLGGQYFKALRELLTNETTPVAFDFISSRNGVFDDVLQETILVVYHVAQTGKAATVSLVVPQGFERLSVEPIGTIRIPNNGGPWIIPRATQDAAYIQTVAKMPTRLADFGYQVATGQLVWNRHKPQLRAQKVNAELPIIWAEAVTSTGFCFSAARRNHAPFIEIHAQPHLITRKACVLLQRTTAKEQGRRLSSAVLPQAFIDEYGGVVVENHLNIIYAPSRSEVLATTICTLLNSDAVDRVFRCINGSVAVSAYELEALPLPSVEQVLAVEGLIQQGADSSEVEVLIASFYKGSS